MSGVNGFIIIGGILLGGFAAVVIAAFDTLKEVVKTSEFGEREESAADYEKDV